MIAYTNKLPWELQVANKIQELIERYKSLQSQGLSQTRIKELWKKDK